MSVGVGRCIMEFCGAVCWGVFWCVWRAYGKADWLRLVVGWAGEMLCCVGLGCVVRRSVM